MRAAWRASSTSCSSVTPNVAKTAPSITKALSQAMFVFRPLNCRRDVAPAMANPTARSSGVGGWRAEVDVVGRHSESPAGPYGRMIRPNVTGLKAGLFEDLLHRCYTAPILGLADLA